MARTACGPADSPTEPHAASSPALSTTCNPPTHACASVARAVPLEHDSLDTKSRLLPSLSPFCLPFFPPANYPPPPPPQQTIKFMAQARREHLAAIHKDDAPAVWGGHSVRAAGSGDAQSEHLFLWRGGRGDC